MPRPTKIALTIAGSDSGGGAGIQADLKTFAALGVFGMSVVTCLTAQNPKAVLGLQPATPTLVRKQLEAVFAELGPQAMKTGMLYSANVVQEIAKFLKKQKQRPPLIVDPVFVSTSGTRLLDAKGITALKTSLLPLATLLTPNIPEAEVLVGGRIRSPEQMRAAARSVQSAFGCAVLIKGGHLQGTKEAMDLLYDGRNEWMLTAPRTKGIKTHGTGCVYSAAITAYCARGIELIKSVELAKQFVSNAIAGKVQTEGQIVLARTLDRIEPEEIFRT